MIHGNCGLWNSLRTLFSWTELRLPVNCASLHIGVDEVLINRCRLLDIHAWQVFRTPWRCSLPVCLYFKLHPDKIEAESCLELITSPRINEPKTSQQQCYAETFYSLTEILNFCWTAFRKKWSFKWFNTIGFALLHLMDWQSGNPDRRQHEHFKRNMSTSENNCSWPKCLPSSKTR